MGLREGGSLRTYTNSRGEVVASINQDGSISFVNLTLNGSVPPVTPVLNPDILLKVPVSGALNTVSIKSVGPAGTPLQAFMVYHETNCPTSGIDYVGIGSIINCIPDANSTANIQRVSSFHAAPCVSGAGATVNNLTVFKTQPEVSGGATVLNVVEFLSFAPVITGGSVVTNWFGIFQDNVTATGGAGTITNYCGAWLGRRSNSGVTIVNSYGLMTDAGTAQIVADDGIAQNSFIGHGAVDGGTMPVTLHDGWYSGTGVPTIVANVGSFYSRRDGGAGTSFYVKESGSGTSSGWVAK